MALDCSPLHIRGSECSTREDEEGGIAYVSMAMASMTNFLVHIIDLELYSPMQYSYYKEIATIFFR